MRSRIHMRDGTTWQTGTVFCSKDPTYAAIGTKPIGLQHSRLAAPPFFADGTRELAVVATKYQPPTRTRMFGFCFGSDSGNLLRTSCTRTSRQTYRPPHCAKVRPGETHPPMAG